MKIYPSLKKTEKPKSVIPTTSTHIPVGRNRLSEWVKEASIIGAAVGGGIVFVLGLLYLLGVNIFNPVETYMRRSLNLPKPIVRELKSLGYDRKMDVNEKALIDEIYYLPQNFQISEKTLSYLKSIASDRTISNEEVLGLRDFRDFEIEKIARTAMKEAISETLNELGYKPQDWHILYESPLDKNKYSSMDMIVGINVDKNETTGVSYLDGIERGMDLIVKFNYIRKWDAKSGEDLVGGSYFDKYHYDHYRRYYRMGEIVFEEYVNPNHRIENLKILYKKILTEGILRMQNELKIR